MKNKVLGLMATLLVLATGGSYSSEKAAPDVLIDKGACPFECCAYRKWKTNYPAAPNSGIRSRRKNPPKVV